MRHFIANIATYLIAVFLLSAAALFGWVRSAQVIISDEETFLAQFTPGPEQFEWADLGEWTYFRNCANCHGADGQGWDQYPGLHETGLLFVTPGGRDHVADLLIYGITSDRWRAPMPSMGHVHDIEMAAAINYVLTRFGNDDGLIEEADLYKPQDIEQRRDLDLTPGQVNERRGDP